MTDKRPDDEELEYVEFEPGDEPAVLTGDLCGFFGGCEKCPGFSTIGKVRPGDSDPGAPVFCIHWCHQLAQQA